VPYGNRVWALPADCRPSHSTPTRYTKVGVANIRRTRGRYNRPRGAGAQFGRKNWQQSRQAEQCGRAAEKTLTNKRAGAADGRGRAAAGGE
jgi:hypothetical protein